LIPSSSQNFTVKSYTDAKLLPSGVLDKGNKHYVSSDQTKRKTTRMTAVNNLVSATHKVSDYLP
jgi:hypothetical protein